MSFRYLGYGIETRFGRWWLIVIWRKPRLIYISPTGAIQHATWIWPR